MENKKMKLGLKRFFFTFILCTFGGTFTLRWLALDFLYRTMDTFVSGISATIISSLALSVVCSGVIYFWLHKIEKIGDKVQETGRVEEKDKKFVLSCYKSVKTIIVLANLGGFFVGQLVCMVLDFKAGVLPYEFSRAFIIMIQASLVGIIAGEYETYYLDNGLGPYRNLLQLRSINDIPGKPHSISSRILIASVSSLLFMWVCAFSCGYAIIHGDNLSGDLMHQYLSYGLRCLVIVGIECIGVMLIILTEMKSRLSATAKLVTNLAETGDVSTRINISMQDDIGIVISSLNFFFDKLEGILINLSTDSSAVSDTAMILEESAQKSVEALKIVKQAVRFIDGQDKSTNEAIKKAYEDIQGVKDNAATVEMEIHEQSVAMQATSTAVSQMNASIENVAEISRLADQVAEKLKATSSEGTLSIKTAVEAIEQIQTASLQIQDIIKMIQKIASQTNLLSMNASIEAAHAGSFGAGFAVVADEVRNLANTSAKNAKTIKDHMNDMTKKIQNGVIAIKEAGNAFSEIDAGVDETVSIVTKIRDASEEQKAGAESTRQATETVVKAISRIVEVANQQTAHAENVYNVMQNIVHSSEEITNALEKTSESVENVGVSLTDVEDCSRINKVSVTSMNDHIGLFKLSKD